MIKKIYLTGKKGFIGGSLYEKLNSSKFLKKKILISYDNFDLKKNFQKRIKILSDTDCVIHCAGRAHIFRDKEKNSFEEFYRVNAVITKKLAELAAKNGVKRFIFLSTIGVNGVITENKFFKSSDTPKPVGNYAISKLKAEKFLWEISRKSGLEVIIIRCPLVYGKKVKGNFLRLLNLLNKVNILPFGRLNNLRSFVGIDNLIDLIACCIVHPKAPGNTFLVSDDKDISTSDLIKKIRKIMKKSTFLIPFPLIFLKFLCKIIGKSNELVSLSNSLQIDCSEAKQILGWKPLTSFDKGILKTVKWYLKNND